MSVLWGLRPISVVSAPVLGGATYAGGSPSVTPPVYSDAGEPDSYSLRVNGVEVESGDEAAIEAYVYTLADEGYTAVLRAIRSGFPDSDSDAVTVDLAAEILAVASAASISVPALFLARRKALDVSVVSDTHVETWINRGTGSNATQGTDSARPTWSDAAINSLPGMTLDGGDVLSTDALDLSAFSAVALSILFSDSDTATRFVAELGPNVFANNPGTFALLTNAGGAGDLEFTHRVGTSQTNRARSAASYAMSTPAVVTGTGDRALMTDETEIRHGATNVTSTRPANNNAASNYSASEELNLGGRTGAASAITGAMSAAILLAQTGAWSDAQLTALALVEARLAAAWGL